ncbi:patched family-domain-containing protein [Peziza echinospora]|nr:patched family-domain-containing protein [Peziza echinospora]
MFSSLTTRLLLIGIFCLTIPIVTAADNHGSAIEPITKIHKAGYCALRGQCGKKSFFGSQLPCPDNGPAKDPEAAVRKKLVDLCGDQWATGPVCCEESQINDLSSNLKRAANIISSCPACKANFFNLFCTFTCSPNQSLFVNVTQTELSNSKKPIVAELDYFVSDEYGSGFYDSCKDVKFSATNGYVMDFIGGGAKDYESFLKFLGDKKALGSPFQINYPRSPPKEITAFDPVPKQCNDADEAYRCACVDCPTVCAELPAVKEANKCMVGSVPCLSLTVMIIYSAFLCSLILGHLGWVFYKRQKESKRERLALLHSPSDDEDEGDIIDGAGIDDKPTKEYFINKYLDALFSKIGTACATYPAITITASVLFVSILSIGWARFSVETDPVRLWVSPSSAAAEEKTFFDSNFGPFYRANQAFLVNDTDGGEVLNYDTLGWWFDVEDRVRRLKSVKEGLTLEDVCFKPTGEGCVVQSITGYFGNDFRTVDPLDWRETLRSCAAQPVQQQCLPDFGQPLKTDLLLGGLGATEDVSRAKALIVTWVVNNHAEGTEEIESAMDWERSLKGLLLAVKEEAEDRGLRLSFSTEISLEQELNKSTNTDAKIVVVSYIAMFIYASLALGSTSLALRTLINTPSKAFVESKFTLGVFGILIVLMSVSASVGLFSAMGVKVTLIIAEVIPFLVLAVGVDNIFLIVHEFQRANYQYPEDVIEVRVGKALGRIGPSILLSASTETIAFALGAIVTMPAVRNFAIYAAGAVFINAILQVTMFVAVLALNEKRVEQGRMDCIPCLKVNGYHDFGGTGDLRGVNGRGQRSAYAAEEEGFLERYIRRSYAPWLLKAKTKVMVLILFLGFFAAGVGLLPKIELGLDQRIAIPSDSYLIDYFNDLYAYLGTGPPVYFVTRSYNATENYKQKALCGRFGTCDPLSVANMLELERKRPEISYIAEPAASWVDDYLLWLNPELESCCSVNRRTGKLCGPYDRNCKVCFADRTPKWNITLAGMPEGEEFLKYLDLWLHAPTGEECPLAGQAAYSNALVYDKKAVTIKASHFRTSHTPMASQEDFINAYASARRIANEMSKNTGTEIFPYSKFYIFFDQYATIVQLTASLLLAALGGIFLVSSILLGSIRTGLTITVTVAMIVIDIMGVMAIWNVSLNAVSLVNLVICVGIAVEFCAHVARAFMFPNHGIYDLATHKYKLRGKDARAWTALVNVGGSVFSGITVTKLIGVSVLAFTRSKIFEIYYFRMWLALVIIAASHALVFLPVALSFMGGQGYVAADEGEGGLEDDLRSRYRQPFLPQDEIDDEDESDAEEER